MASPLKAASWRRVLWALGVGAGVLALVLLALPYLASTRIARDRIAVELSNWTGYRVTLREAPRLMLFPRLRAELAGVTFEPWANRQGYPVLEAERIELKLDPMAALRGSVAFSSGSIFAPTLYVARGGDGLYYPAPPGGGRVARALESARGVIAEKRQSPDLARLPRDPFGDIEFFDGRVVDGGDAARPELLSAVNGKLSWPAMDEPGWLLSTAIWRGQTVSVNVSCTDPMLVLGGGTAQISLSVGAPPATLQFDGSASLMQDGFVDGQASLAAPSLARLLEWTHGRDPAGAALGALALGGRLIGSSQRLRLESASLTLDGSQASGLLEVQEAGQRRLVAGTLAFETLDLKALLSAILPLQLTESADATRSGLADLADLDLRLSAGRAALGTLVLSDIAATARVREGLTAFDISDASGLGGRIQAGVRFDRAAGGSQAELRLLASDIEGGAAAAAIGLSRLVPVGRGTVSIILKGPAAALDRVADRASGSLAATFAAGAISGFDLAGFLSRAAGGGFFSLDDVAKGTLPTTGIEIKASMSNGVASIEKAEIRTPSNRITLSGIVPYVGRGLALTGSVWPAGGQPAKSDAASAPIAAFFVGGPWTTPFISPVATPPQP